MVKTFPANATIEDIAQGKYGEYTIKDIVSLPYNQKVEYWKKYVLPMTKFPSQYAAEYQQAGKNAFDFNTMEWKNIKDLENEGLLKADTTIYPDTPKTQRTETVFTTRSIPEQIALTGEQAKEFENIRYKLRAQDVYGLKGMGERLAPNVDIAKQSLAQQGITDYTVTPQELANLKQAAAEQTIPPLEDYEVSYLAKQTLPATTLASSFTGKTGVVGEKTYPSPAVVPSTIQGTAQTAQSLKIAPQITPDLKDITTKQAQQLGNNVMANKEYVNGVFKAWLGRDATAAELKQYTGKGVLDVYNSIKGVAPVGGVSAQDVMKKGITPEEDLSSFAIEQAGLGTTGEILSDWKKAMEEINKPVSQIQKTVIDTLLAQPKASDTLKQLKDQYGQDALIAELKKLSEVAAPLEDALNKLPEDIKSRYQDIGLTQAQINRRYALEAKPLTDSLNAVNRKISLTQDQLKANNSLISEALDLILKDQETSNGVLMQQLEFAKNDAAKQADILDTQMKIAISAIEDQLKADQPDIITSTNTDSVGNVTITGINKTTGEKVWEQKLGKIEKAIKTSGITVADTSGFVEKQVSTKNFDDQNYVSSLPISTISKAIISGYGTVKDLTPTDKKTVISELYKVGYEPKSYILDKLDTLVNLYEETPNKMKGLVQGYTPSTLSEKAAAFESAKVVLTRQIARLYDVGMLSDQDVASYKEALPSRTDRNVNVVKSKVASLKSVIGTSKKILKVKEKSSGLTGTIPEDEYDAKLYEIIK